MELGAEQEENCEVESDGFSRAEQLRVRPFAKKAKRHRPNVLGGVQGVTVAPPFTEARTGAECRLSHTPFPVHFRARHQTSYTTDKDDACGKHAPGESSTPSQVIALGRS